MTDDEWIDPALEAAYKAGAELRDELATARGRITTLELELSEAQGVLKDVRAMNPMPGPVPERPTKPGKVARVIDDYFKEFRRIYEGS